MVGKVNPPKLEVVRALGNSQPFPPTHVPRFQKKLNLGERWWKLVSQSFEKPTPPITYPPEAIRVSFLAENYGKPLVYPPPRMPVTDEGS